MNMNLNAGGVLGGLLGAAAAGGIGAAITDGTQAPAIAKLVIFGVTVGAVAGNFLWSAVVPKPKPRPRDEEPHDRRPVRRGPPPLPRQPPRSLIRILTGIVGLGVAAVSLLVLVLAGLNYSAERETTRWPRVPAEMTKFEAKPSTKEPGRHHVFVQYKYEANGMKFVGYDFAPDPVIDPAEVEPLRAEYAPGKTVEVSHSPTIASRSVLRPAVTPMAGYLVVIPVAPLLLGLALTAFGFWPRRAKRPEAAGSR